MKMIRFFVFPCNGAPVEWNWQGKTEVLGEKPVPVTICPPQIAHGLIRDRTRASAVRGRRLTAWAMARPSCRVTWRTDFAHRLGLQTSQKVTQRFGNWIYSRPQKQNVTVKVWLSFKCWLHFERQRRPGLPIFRVSVSLLTASRAPCRRQAFTYTTKTETRRNLTPKWDANPWSKCSSHHKTKKATVVVGNLPLPHLRETLYADTRFCSWKVNHYLHCIKYLAWLEITH